MGCSHIHDFVCEFGQWNDADSVSNRGENHPHMTGQMLKKQLPASKVVAQSPRSCCRRQRSCEGQILCAE